MDIELIRNWATLGESDTLEFKKSTAEKERTCRTLCAFANGRGGRVLIGVAPSGNPAGQVVTDRTLEELAQEFRGFEPPLFPALDRVAVGSGNEVLVLTVVRSPRAPGSRLMRRAERFLIESLPIAGRIEPGKMERTDTPLLPVEAMREALANAFVHRDYSIGGGSVNVALYDDRLEIISIGDLHFGFTPEALFLEHESKPWNPMIARTFYRRGIIETWGRGTLKIARLMLEAGHQPPAFSRREGAVVVTFGLPGKSPLAVSAEKTTGKTTGKTPEKVWHFLAENPHLSVPEIAAHLEKSELTIHRAIRTLRESGRLERVGPDKGGHWKVNQ